MQNSTYRKLKKLFTNPNLYFYDLFRKRLNINQNNINNINAKIISVQNPPIQNHLPQIKPRFNDEQLISILSKIDQTCLTSGNEIWKILDSGENISAVRRNYLDQFELFFKNFEWYSPVKNKNDWSVALIHGRPGDLASIVFLTNALEFNSKKIFVEDGFIHSIERPASRKCKKIYRLGCSLLVDTQSCYYDATKESCIEQELNSSEKYSSEELMRARKLIDEIISNKISKYNNQPLEFELDIDKSKYSKVVLVVDQACNDWSIRKGYASKETFTSMLDSAISENQDALILVKVHPDMINNPNRGGVKNQTLGHYTDYRISELEKGRIKFIATYANCYSVLEKVDKVYVCTSQFGFEALMANKEVHIFGSPYYAGWGLGVQRNSSPAIARRRRKHTIEELFATAYLHFSRYINPITGERCELEELINAIKFLRTKYFKELEFKKQHYENYCEPRINDVIKVVFAFDDNYALQGLVAILSLLESDPDNQYGIYCLSKDGISESNKKLFDKFCNVYQNLQFINYVNPKSYTYTNSYQSRYLNDSAYLRFEIHRLIKEDRVIYSDADVLFLRGLSDAWKNSAKKGYLIGACIDVGLNTLNIFTQKARTLGYWNKYFEFRRGQYFSSGFLVMNLDEIRKSKIETEWIRLSNEKFEHHDMDVINIACYPKIDIVSSRYCIIPRYLKNNGYLTGIKEGFLPEEEQDLIINAPVIYHYAGPHKPWKEPNVEGGKIWWNFVKKFPELEILFQKKYASSLLRNEN